MALLCAAVLWCLLHGSPASLNSVATSFEASCERLPCGLPSTEYFVVEPSCSISLSLSLISSSSVVGSRSATLDLATAQTRLSSARGLQHWTWRLHCCFAGTEHQHVLDLTVDLTWHLHVHPSRCSDHPVQGVNLLCFISSLQCLYVAVFWHCISAGTSTFMYCCCETSVLCCTFMCCTCGNFNGLCKVRTIMSMYCTW